MPSHSAYFFHWDIWYDTVSLLNSSKVANKCQVIHQNRCQKWQTFPSPVRFVNITTWQISSCHTIPQKSVTMFALRPDIAYNWKKNISDLNLTKSSFMSCHVTLRNVLQICVSIGFLDVILSNAFNFVTRHIKSGWFVSN